MKIFKISLCLLLIVSAFAGCSDSRGLSEMTIVQGVGIDLNEDKTTVSLQYLDLQKSGGVADSLGGNITTTATGTADSIADAMAFTSRVLSQQIFLGQNKIIVFGNEYAKNGIEKGLDYLLRSVASRPDVAVAMSLSSADDVIKNTQRDVRIPAESLYEMLQLGEKNGLGAVVTVNDLLNLYSDQTSDIYLPVLNVNDDTISCDGVAIFSNARLVGVLEDEKCFGFLFVKDKIEGGTLVVHDTDLGAVGVEISSSKTKLWFEMNGDKPVLHCNVNTKLMLDELEKGISSSVTESKISQIEKLVNEKIETMCLSAINTCFESKCDPFMFGRYASRDIPKFYQSHNSEWRDNLSSIETKIYVNAELVRVNDNSVRS